jgi:hypothetical protein
MSSRRSIPRREPDPPLGWKLAASYYFLGVVATLTFLALVGALTGDIL